MLASILGMATITHCQSITINPKMKAAASADTAGLPTGAAIVRRNAPIPVQRESPEGMMLTDASETITTVGSGVTEPVAAVFAERPEYSDEDMAKAEFTELENGVGVPPQERESQQPVSAASHISGAPTTPVITQTRKMVPVDNSQKVVVEKRVPAGSVPRIPTAQATNMPVVIPKVRVRLSSPGMGRHTITVRSVAISDTLVVLAYPKDAENIIEPPDSDRENPITVDYGEKKYQCMFGGWTAEIENLFLVVLIRCDGDDA